MSAKVTSAALLPRRRVAARVEVRHEVLLGDHTAAPVAPLVPQHGRVPGQHDGAAATCRAWRRRAADQPGGELAGRASGRPGTTRRHPPSAAMTAATSSSTARACGWTARTAPRPRVRRWRWRLRRPGCTMRCAAVGATAMGVASDVPLTSVRVSTAETSRSTRGSSGTMPPGFLTLAAQRLLTPGPMLGRCRPYTSGCEQAPGLPPQPSCRRAQPASVPDGRGIGRSISFSDTLDQHAGLIRWEDKMADRTYRVTEIVGTSPDGSRSQAVRNEHCAAPWARPSGIWTGSR